MGYPAEDGIDEYLLRFGQIAVRVAMWAAERAFRLPFTVQPQSTSFKKVSSSDNVGRDDPTEPIDHGAESAINRVLEVCAKKDGPLSGGYLRVDEETGVNAVTGKHGAAGASVLSLDGQPIDPSIIPDMQDLMKQGFTGESKEACRQKFIVAGTEELGLEIAQTLSGQIAECSSQSESVNDRSS